MKHLIECNDNMFCLIEYWVQPLRDNMNKIIWENQGKNIPMRHNVIQHISLYVKTESESQYIKVKIPSVFFKNMSKKIESIENESIPDQSFDEDF